MIASALTREDALRARLGAYRRLVARSEAHVRDALATIDRPYVSFSGGKDSLVVLDLVRRQHPDITAIWIDDELEYPEQPEYIPALCATVDVQLYVKTGTQLHAGWFRSWSDEPFWRDPLPGTLVTRESIRTLAPALGFDGVLLGLRADEARHRRIREARWGPLHRIADGTWRANPLRGWTTADVWAYIAERGLPYNPVYDTLARIGVPRERARIGPLPLSDGWVLEAGWGGMYRDLVARYGRMW